MASSSRPSLGFLLVLAFLLLPAVAALNFDGVTSLAALLTGRPANGVILNKGRLAYSWQVTERDSRGIEHDVVRTADDLTLGVRLEGSAQTFLPDYVVAVPRDVWDRYHEGHSVALLVREKFPQGAVLQDVGWRSDGVLMLLLSVGLILGILIFFRRR